MMKLEKEYAPSKKFTLTAIFAIIVVLLAITLGDRVAPVKSDPEKDIKVALQEEEAASLRVAQEKEKIINELEADSDGDGLKDWEETLWGTDPFNPDSDGDGILDGLAIENERQRLNKEETEILASLKIKEETLTKTDEFARETYTALAVMAGTSGEVTEDGIEYLSEKAAQQAYEMFEVKQYTLKDLDIVKDSEINNARFIQSFEKNRSVYGFELSDINKLNQYITEGFEIGLYKDIVEKNAYGLELYSDNLLKIKVPESGAILYLEIVNDTTRVAATLQSLLQIEYDPLISYMALFDYKQSVTNMLESHTKMLKYIEQEGNKLI